MQVAATDFGASATGQLPFTSPLGAGNAIIAGGTDSVTATLTAPPTSQFEVYVHEYAGLASFDVGRAANGTSAAVSSGTVNLTGSNELVFGYAWSNDTATAGAGFTARSSYHSNVTEDLITSSPGSYAATATQNGTAWTMIVGAFKGF